MIKGKEVSKAAMQLFVRGNETFLVLVLYETPTLVALKASAFERESIIERASSSAPQVQ